MALPTEAERPTTALVRAAAGHTGRGAGDERFERGVTGLAILPILALIGIIVLLFIDARDALLRYGFGFLVDTTWDPVFERFGAAAFVYGTLVTSAIAVLLAAPLGVGAALFISEYAPGWLKDKVSFVVELLAVVPSIIYGLWGFFVLAPIMRYQVEPALKAWFGPLPVVGGLFAGPTLGRDLLTGGVILAIMILPTIMAISREVFRATPDTQREGMIALGATKWETIANAVLPYARVGVAGAITLGLARALGETMAVTMVIGNSSKNITGSLFTPGYTVASAIANQFVEADKEIYFSAIVALALVLLAVSAITNLLATWLMRRIARGSSQARRL